jgi:transcriptional regulator with XRE-family HTH domain
MTGTQISINQKVKALIKMSGKSPSEVANELNVHRQQVSEWCTEGKSVGKKTIDKLLTIFPNVNYEYFFSNEELKVEEPPNLNYNTTKKNQTIMDEHVMLLTANVRQLMQRVEELEKQFRSIENPSKKKDHAG